MPEASATAEGRDGSVSHEGSETWSDGQYSLLVTQKDGFFCTIRLAAILDLPPDEAFALLARPDSHKIFKSITDNTYRKVVACRQSDAGREIMQVETEARARWKLGVFRGSFNTRLMVDLHAPNGTIDFKLTKKEGIMKAFEGHWRVRPWNGSPSLDSVVKVAAEDERAAMNDSRDEVCQPGRSSQQGPRLDLARLSDWVPNLWRQHGSGNRHKRRRCLVTLEQSLMPSVVPPGPLGNIVRGISAAQVRGMIGDLQAEVQRINAGAPTPTSDGNVCLVAEFGFPGCNSDASSGSSTTRGSRSDSRRGGGCVSGKKMGVGNGSGCGAGRGRGSARLAGGGGGGPADGCQAGDNYVSSAPAWLRHLDDTPLRQPARFLAARNQEARKRRLNWLADVGLCVEGADRID